MPLFLETVTIVTKRKKRVAARINILRGMALCAGPSECDLVSRPEREADIGKRMGYRWILELTPAGPGHHRRHRYLRLLVFTRMSA